MSASAGTCPVCGAARRFDGPAGQCPACLLRLAAGAPPPPTTTDLPDSWRPMDCDDFVVEERLGEGPRGVVYRAEQPGIGRPVALKCFTAGEEGWQAQLAAAADRLGAVEHPALAPVFAVGVNCGRPYVMLPLAAGGNLHRQLAGEPPPAELVARLGAVLARAVAAAHQAGLVHGRLTPANVLFDAAGFPALSDFVCAGLPCAEGAGNGADLEFLAPETGTGTGATRAADIYSLGALLRLVLRHVRPTAEDEELVSALQAVARHCLDPAPAKRPASAAEVAAALEFWLHPVPVRPPPSARPGDTVAWA